MKLNDIEIPPNDLQDVFANHFKEKVENIVSEGNINPNVYNGTRKLFVTNLDFMTEDNILDAVLALKIKNSEGFDRIPQRFLIDGISVLIKPLTVLFNLIYNTKKVPDQWLVSKIIPIFKKGT